MEIKTYQKATALLEAIKKAEDKERDLEFMHKNHSSEIVVTTIMGHTKIQCLGGDALHIIEYLQMRNKKELESLKLQLEKL